MKIKIDDLLNDITDNQIAIASYDIVSLGRIKEKTFAKINSKAITHHRHLFWISIIAAILVTTSVAAAMAISSSHILAQIEYTVSDDGLILPLEKPDWELEIHSSNITSTGMDLTCIHCDGDYSGQLMIGDHFYIETAPDSEQRPASNGNVHVIEQWNGVEIPRNSIISLTIDWSDIYGTLPAGDYKLHIPIWELNDRSVGRYCDHVIEFTVIGGERRAQCVPTG